MPLGRFPKRANHALIVMVRGARVKFKQPIAYYFTKDTVSSECLKQILFLAVQKLEFINLHVLTTICDQGPTNMKATNLLCSETVSNTPSMTHFVVDQSFIVNRMFDVGHLLKNTRNALVECDMEFELGKLAKWEHIYQLYQIDQQQQFKILYKLRPEHFNFKDSYNKMKVCVAARQLSKQVSIGLRIYALKDGKNPKSPNRLPAEAKHTAKFLELIDSLFDSFNSFSKTAEDGKALRCAVSDESPHENFWIEQMEID
jgi:hypothetical protein